LPEALDLVLWWEVGSARLARKNLLLALISTAGVLAVLVVALLLRARPVAPRTPRAQPSATRPRPRQHLQGEPEPAHADPLAAPDEEPSAEEPMAPLESPTGMREALNRRDLEGGMAHVKSRVQKCIEDPLDGVISARMTIGRSGSVQTVELLPPFDSAPQAECLAKALKHAAFPAFRGALQPTIELTFPFLVRGGQVAFQPPEKHQHGERQPSR
jgi:hypothetical protein